MNTSATTLRRLGGALALAALVVLALPSAARAARIKDVARVQGVRPNQLVGYGLVVGLERTGDTERSIFTQQSLSAMLSRMGVRIDARELRLRNVAAVMVTAELPSLARPGTPIDVVVSAIGDARSLQGGTLLMTPLDGVDGETYAMAQGPLQIGGFGARGLSGSSLRKGHLNVGRIPSGGTVERAVPVDLAAGGVLRIQLDRPDFGTAREIATAVNEASGDLGGTTDMAQPADAGVIEVQVPEGRRDRVPVFIAEVEALEVQPDNPARVVINGRTGTVVVGRFVRIDPVAVAHGPLTVRVEEAARVAQPQPLAGGETVVTPESRVEATEEQDALRVVPRGATLEDVVQGLNALGARPRDLVDILQAIHAAGALHAELEVI
ncbi:MAG: flagellar basal body P-ring protein FlgI [Myxococcota bacterium]